MNSLEIKNVSHSIGNKTILTNINLTIPIGQIAALVGPSGSGKSTLLRAILGTHPPSSGEIYAEGIPIKRPSRNVGIVYQHYSLYDFMTAEQNVAFGLDQDKTSLPYRWFGHFCGWSALKREHLKQAKEMLTQVGLGQSIKLYPGEMSGGMKQRVAIAQSLIVQPKVLLLDEPFGALDEATREELQDMIVNLSDQNKQAIAIGETPPHTILIVTHELNEAIYLSDRVIGLSQFHKAGGGATIIYDKVATAFDRKSERDYSLFLAQKEELRNIVFNVDNKDPAEKHCCYWEQK